MGDMSRGGLATILPAGAAGSAAIAAPHTPSLRIPDRIVLDLLALIEIGLVAAAAAIAEVVYLAFFLANEPDHQPYIFAGLAGGLIVHYMMRLRGLDQPAAIIAWRRRLGELIVSIGLAFLVLIALAYLLKISADYSRGWLLTWLGLTFILVPASRPLSARLLGWLASAGYTARRIAIVGSAAAGHQLAARLSRTAGVRVVGVFSDCDDETARATFSDLISAGRANRIDEVVVALTDAPHRSTARLVDELGVLPVDVWLCPAGLNLPILSTERLGALSLLQVNPKPIGEWGYFIKLVLDYVAGSVCLVLLTPLMLAIAIAIRIESSGPVFFRQRRHGYNHDIIDVYKFRTMLVAENGDRVVQAQKNDPRVTRLGKFLRRTSLDELPQLFNVLKGEMSLVGPRPHAVAHNQYYGDRLERYANRHRVKPGMTGWAQINGFRGPTEDPEKMRKRVEHDLHYIENWSIGLDLKILALTPFVGFINRNAF
jgi:putative colanic acid biosynthesis UDP-glucose lipid carrier transferase